MTKLTALILTVLLLSACAKTITSCPPIVEYDSAFSAQLAEELERSAAEQVWPRAIVDYHALREQLRKCQP